MRRMWDEIHTLHYDMFDEAAADPEAAATRQGQPAGAGAAAEAAVPVRQVGPRLEVPLHARVLWPQFCQWAVCIANIALEDTRWSYKLAASSRMWLDSHVHRAGL